MRTTIDIPDALYRRLKGKAAAEGRSVKEIILLSVEEQIAPKRQSRTRRVKPPIIPSKRPGTLDLDNAKIYEIIPFP